MPRVIGWRESQILKSKIVHFHVLENEDVLILLNNGTIYRSYGWPRDKGEWREETWHHHLAEYMRQKDFEAGDRS